MGLFHSSSRHLVESGKVETLIGAEACVRGVLSPKGSLRIDGRVEGSISDAQSVVVSSTGAVRGDVSAEVVIVGGKIEGNVSVTESIEVLADGRVRGDLRTPKLIVEDGGILNGRCTMGGRDDETAPSGKDEAEVEQEEESELEAASSKR